MRTLALLSLAALAGCASSSSSTPAAAPAPVETVRVSGSGATGGAIAMGMTATPPNAKTSSLPYSMDDIWRVLPGAYESVGVPLTVRDVAGHRMGNEGFSGRRQLKGTSMTRYFDCGQTQMAPSADTYEIHLSVITIAIPGEAGATTLATTVDAQARPVAFSGEYVRCSSKGALEQRISDAVKAALQK